MAGCRGHFEKGKGFVVDETWTDEDDMELLKEFIAKHRDTPVIEVQCQTGHTTTTILLPPHGKEEPKL